VTTLLVAQGFYKGSHEIEHPPYTVGYKINPRGCEARESASKNSLYLWVAINQIGGSHAGKDKRSVGRVLRRERLPL
jgi:hypothetical protein